MSRRNRKRSRPQSQRPKPPAAPAEAAPSGGGFDQLRDELRDDFDLVVDRGEEYDPAVGDPVLRRLLDGLRGGGLAEQEQIEVDVGLSSAGLSVSTLPDPEEAEESEEEAAARVEEELAEVHDREADEEPPVSDDDDEGYDELASLEIEIPELERGPLAGGILIMEAMLTEAKAGFITAQITVLEAAINEEFTPRERVLMVDAASKWRDASGLPDVPAAYRALVVHRAQGG